MEYEKSHGTTILAHSDGSIDAYPQNSPSSFTNILQKPLHLDNDEIFEVGISNVHLPTKQYILLKDDDESAITYNIGLFLYDKVIDEWILIKNSDRVMFTYIPSKNIEPVLTDSNAERLFLLKRLPRVLKIRRNSDDTSNLAHKLFQTLLFHYTDEAHGPITESFKGCQKCLGIIETKFKYMSELYLTSIFDNFDTENRNHIALKRLKIEDDILAAQIYEDFFEFLKIDPREYMKTVITKEVRDAVHDNTLSDILSYSMEHNMLGPEREITKPVMAIYTTFGSRVSEFLNIHKDTKYFIHSDDLDMETPLKNIKSKQSNIIRY